MACLNKNDFNKEKCTAYFQAYRECKRAWVCYSWISGVICS